MRSCVSTSFCRGTTKVIDMSAAGVPGFVAFVNRDAVIDEPSANGVFHLVDAMVKRLAILDQRAKLAVSFRGHVNGL